MKTVAVIVQDGAEPFGLGSLVEVWGEPYHADDDNPVFDFRVCTPRPGRVRGRAGFDLHVEHGLDAIEDADLVCFSPKHEFLDFDPAVIAAAQATYERGAIVYAHCSASFLLAEAGLLDGRECTTHWRYGELMARRYPRAIVRPDVLYVQDGTILTGAGSAAGIDASLHLMRQTFGAKVATTTARRIVVPPHRDGGQAQFVRTPMKTTDVETLAPLLDWMTAHLDEPLPVERLARHAHTSARTFARRFRDETGTTPLQWVTNQRLALAEEMLEGSGLSVEQIATRVGFGNAATLRHHFSAARGTTPLQYRRTFASVDEAV
ncbi:GlxA family transcriptional regulator [Aeromicrobium stalagmiti]|uniref:GlxA family transcriptional regulator n=1 Tax=Aeromicrobium stalagmiti TaxID=2738988 RepID=UPI001569D682|nr:helix-turn-helix domain-containing protein [Aeromicrobium stalagmiti]NRQ50922.1 helix-turn-helix domain-containing protein [Aeromicrobium stalagmiti]